MATALLSARGRVTCSIPSARAMQPSAGLPNLFVLGAGKSGTTTLHQLLGRHPDIHVCDPKEPSFFCSHFQVVRDPVSYFRLFASDRRYRVDASHVYFSNPETAPVLRALFPEAKVLLILRHPKARAHSLYRHMRLSMHDDGRPLELAETFYEALRLEDERFHSPDFMRNCRQYFWNFMYIRSSFYDEQLTRYLGLFTREQFLIMTLAELISRPQQKIAEIAAFLEVEPSGFGESVPVVNAAPAYEGFDQMCDAFMGDRFGDLTRRVDALVGRAMDWSV
ncbi:sulfotransferase [Aquabacter sp. L1I39]|uniref:sulfotransferase family protein n=1 Tax=Aquabacter sp. L1I39 TaxID=2820278 RepID=UPI001ADD5D3D|nr:sulfotransferase [Aquabacter sp. L1I39]QTL03685.1 sulfotransferase [Aquabacter sp. L1I39]